MFTVVTILAFFVRHLADHAQRNDLFARLHTQASTDPLTGVGNRFVLDELADERTTASMDVIVVGIDGLPAFNNAVGHAEGDALLVRVAVALARPVRRCARRSCASSPTSSRSSSTMSTSWSTSP